MYKYDIFLHEGEAKYSEQIAFIQYFKFLTISYLSYNLQL